MRLYGVLQGRVGRSGLPRMVFRTEHARPCMTPSNASRWERSGRERRERFDGEACRVIWRGNRVRQIDVLRTWFTPHGHGAGTFPFSPEPRERTGMAACPSAGMSRRVPMFRIAERRWCWRVSFGRLEMKRVEVCDGAGDEE